MLVSNMPFTCTHTHTHSTRVCHSLPLGEDQGAKDSARRAYERWNQLLKDYQAPHMDEAKDEELKEFIGKRKSELPDAWY